ncbi:MAG: hypothetical protein ABMA14_23050 [Hyphomonadaceae bacterium]|jgi:hypothetical protein
MLKWMCVATASLAFATPAFAQKTDLPDRTAKQIGQFDVAAMQEGNNTLKLNGSCTAQYIVSVEGKAKDITLDCTHPEMAPYILRTIETGTWDPEVFDHEFFDSFPFRQVFNYGTGTAGPDPRGEKSPVLDTGVDAKDVQDAIKKVKEEGVCEVKYTVGADGKPKDIAPNCTPAGYNEPIAAAIAKMEFKPGLKAGAPTDWPGMSMPIKLAAPKKKS